MKELFLTRHSIERMAKRNISIEMIKSIIQNGEVIKDYPEDNPYPSKLYLGYINHRPLHVVIANHPEYELIVTAYEPSLDSWESDFKGRKK